MKQKYITLILLKMKKLHFRSLVSFDREQHKCDPQMNNTRGLKATASY